jgi:hypothetical protein
VEGDGLLGCAVESNCRPPIGFLLNARAVVTDCPGIVGDAASIALRKLAFPGFGAGNFCHAEPFQCKMSARSWVPSLYAPTAQMFEAETACTAVSSLPVLPGTGLGTTGQAASGLRMRPIWRRLMSWMLGRAFLVAQLRKPWVFNRSSHFSAC